MTATVSVMGDEEEAQFVLRAQVPQQIQNLSLNRNIQGTRWLVEHDQSGARRDRAGDSDTLTLATRQLVW